MKREHPWEKCGKPCEESRGGGGGKCVRRRNHKGKHRDYTNPDCILGTEMVLRGYSYSCACGDHAAAQKALDAFVAVGGCMGCDPPWSVYTQCPQHGEARQAEAS